MQTRMDHVFYLTINFICIKFNAVCDTCAFNVFLFRWKVRKLSQKNWPKLWLISAVGVRRR